MLHQPEYLRNHLLLSGLKLAVLWMRHGAELRVAWRTHLALAGLKLIFLFFCVWTLFLKPHRGQLTLKTSKVRWDDFHLRFRYENFGTDQGCLFYVVYSCLLQNTFLFRYNFLQGNNYFTRAVFLGSSLVCNFKRCLLSMVILTVMPHLQVFVTLPDWAWDWNFPCWISSSGLSFGKLLVKFILAVSENKTLKRCLVPVKNPYGYSFSTSCTLEQELDVELKNGFWFRAYLFCCEWKKTNSFFFRLWLFKESAV